jgi:iron complex outermembrane receptor protein
MWETRLSLHRTALALWVSSVALLVCCPARAHSADVDTPAQTAETGSRTDQPSSELGEIIVSARKRDETILNVPVVEIPITQAQLAAQQTTDLKDVSAFVPGLSLSQTLASSGIQVSLRGVGTNSQGAGIDASVALNVDGLQITQGIAYSSAIFDLAQVEVLKGPQALFYGKNSPGGVISLRSADPTDKFELIGSEGYEIEAAEHRAQFIISGPVTDSLRLRLATQYDTQKGYFTNDAVATPGFGGLDPQSRSAPGDRAYVIRGTAIWQPTEQFDAHLKVNFTNDRLTNGAAIEYKSCPDGNGPVPPRNIPFLGGASCQVGRDLQVVDLSPSAFKGLLDNSGALFNETNQGFGTLELNYRPRPDITLTSVSGFYHLYFQSQQNGTDSTAAGPGLVSLSEPFTRRDFTEELRVNSDFAGPLNFTAGGFYQNGRLFNHGVLPGNTAIGLPASLGNFEQALDIHSTSAFGQVRWKIIPTVEIAAGARWTDEIRDLTVWNVITGSPVVFPTAVPSIASDNLSPEATITFKPTGDFTTFASYKQGFKSGSFQLTQPSGVLPSENFGDEKVEGWEVGAKAQLMDRHLYTDIAFYDYRYKGLQVGANQVQPNGVPAARTLNAGGAHVYGVDFDINYLPPAIEGLRVQGSVEVNHARFTSLNGVPCWGGEMVSQGCNQLLNPLTHLYTAQGNLTGLPLLRAPNWQANLGFNYDKPIARGLTLSFMNMNQFSSRYLTDLGLRGDFYQASFFKTDVGVALKGSNDKWEFAVVGKNLGDVLTTGSCVNLNGQAGAVLGGEVTGGTTRGLAGVDELACYMDRGREVWLRLTLRPFN